MHRFKDQHYHFSIPSGLILVHCPKCNGKAQVQYHRNAGYKVDILCNDCGYYYIDNKTYYSLDFGRNCPQCGKRTAFKIDKIAASNKKESMKITCPHCHFTENYKPSYIEHRVSNGDIRKGKDRYFNADLWLQKDFRGDLFWATNYSHLEHLEQYIGAQVRERAVMGHGIRRMTMITKLPKFIKSHKNRSGLLRVIRQLKNK